MTTDKTPQLIESRLKGLRLEKGAHSSCEDGLCAMEAAAFIYAFPHSDRDPRACPILAAITRSWNDYTDDETRQLIVPLLPRLALSKSTPAVEVKRAYHLLDCLVRIVVPGILEEAEEREWAAKFRALPKIEDATTIRRSREVVASFYDFLATPSTSPAPSSLLQKKSLARARALDLARARALDLDLARDLDLDLDLALALALDLARDRARARARALDLALARARARARALDLALPTDVSRRLVFVPVLGAIETALAITE